jgi:hypothetical protein
VKKVKRNRWSVARRAEARYKDLRYNTPVTRPVRVYVRRPGGRSEVDGKDYRMRVVSTMIREISYGSALDAGLRSSR